MKIGPYVEKLNNSQGFKEFRSKYKDAFLVAGFFVLDFETGQNLHQIDYYIPSEKKVAAFTLDKKVILQILDTMSEKVPEKLDLPTNIDLEALRGILEDEMKNRNMTEQIRKIIAVIQNVKGTKMWILNCILSGMEILKAHVDDSTKTVLKMEKASVLDYVKKIPGGMGKGGVPTKMPTPSDIDKQIQQLDKLKEALIKEKGELLGQEDTKEERAEKARQIIASLINADKLRQEELEKKAKAKSSEEKGKSKDKEDSDKKKKKKKDKKD